MVQNMIEAELAFVNINHPAFNRSLEYTQEELSKVYPKGHPEYKENERKSIKQRARKMTFYAAPGDFLNKVVLSKH